MAVENDRASELADHLRRWTVIGGFALGGWAILQSILAIAAWGLPFHRYFRIELLTPIHRLASALLLVAPLLLVAGCWGFHQHRWWARPVLLTYAGMWIAGIFGTQIVQIVDLLSGTYGELTFPARFSAALGQIDLSVYGSVFAVSLILCLTLPGVRDQFPEFRNGFSPIVDGEAR